MISIIVLYTFKYYLDISCPLKNNKLNKSGRPKEKWVTGEIAVSKKNVMNAFDLWKVSKTRENKYIYNNLKNNL